MNSIPIPTEPGQRSEGPEAGRIIHYDISDYAKWRSACGARPTVDGTNLTVADYQITCVKCLKALGYEVAADTQRVRVAA